MIKKQFVKYYNKKSLWEKLKKFSRQAGQKVVYNVLLLYYVMIDKGVSLKTKTAIAAALGYFILPLDAIPDLTPLIGFSDDLGILLFTLSQVSGNITPEIKIRAKKQLLDWFDRNGKTELKGFESQNF